MGISMASVSHSSYDTIIVGAGLSGLAAGIRLAHYGQRVAILERHQFPGGLNSFYRRNGEWISVGLHAVTNFVGADQRRAPLNRLLRQLRLRHEDLDLCPQSFSLVTALGTSLRFTNDFSVFSADVVRTFPDQAEGFAALVEHIRAYDSLALDAEHESTRTTLARFIDSPDLVDLLFQPVMYYGNACEHDMDFGQFCVMFQSIFLEGFSRPRRGMRPVIKTLVDRFRSSGGELCLRCGVRGLSTDGDRVTGVVLDDGTQCTARQVLSCAGYIETLSLCEPTVTTHRREGALGYAETMFVLDCEPAELGHESCIEFFRTSPRFAYRVPDGLIDSTSGVLCAPGNFSTGAEGTERNQLRVTQLASPALWFALDAEAYAAAKHDAMDRQLAWLETRLPGVSAHVVDQDMFTPVTVHRFSGHRNGSIYGTPDKQADGTTPYANLFVSGTDQGFLGIIGSMLSGVSIANLHLLKD
jgi:phytoene dehydrogenase-like protein